MIKPFTEVTPQKPPDLCAKHRFFMSDIRFAILCVFWYNENSLRRMLAYEQSDILNGYIVPEYEVLHTQSREYIVDDLLDVMKERGVEV